MRGRSKMCRLGAVALLLSLASTAQAGKKHPGYIRTLEDLRTARALLERPGRVQDANAPDEVSLTITNIDRAIDEINQEAAPKNKKQPSAPHINPKMKWGNRLSESLRMVERARLDCAKEKDDAANAGTLARIERLLDDAHMRLTVAIQTKNFDYDARNMSTRND